MNEVSGKLLFAIILVVGAASGISAADPLCEGLPPNEIFAFPHETNCSLYYECYGGNKILMACANGLWFNSDTQSCDFPDESGCTNKESICTNVVIDYFPHPSDCSRYIECYQGNSYEMSCQPGLWFHSGLKKCVAPEESDCMGFTTPPWTTPHPICWGVRPSETVLKPYEGDCRKYWQCIGADMTLQDCPNYLLFDESRQLCDFPETVNCDDTTRTPDPWTTRPPTTRNPTTPADNDPRCTGQGLSYWSHPIYCNKYIECYNGGSYEMNCPAGLYFSQEKRHCVNPSESECGRTEPPTHGPTSERPTDWTPHPDCPWPESEGKLMPYPGDCTKFYECAEGKKVAMNCPDALWFNPSILECDYPYQAGCQWGFLD
jgi:hypothetical protein